MGTKKTRHVLFNVKLGAFVNLAVAFFFPLLLKQATFYFDSLLRKMDVVNAVSFLLCLSVSVV